MAAAGSPSDAFGSVVPYSEPYWYRASETSPYYTEAHVAFRAKVRAFVDAELIPHVDAWDEAGAFPEELHRKAYAAGIYAAAWPVEHGGTPPPGGFDAFHDLILIDELARCGAGGVLWSCFQCFGIALPPVLAAGSPDLIRRVARPVITGEKVMSLAVSEPWAGSDVANLRTTARREGDVFVVNGEKKWITGGNKAAFFTVAVRTGGPGFNGVSLLLIEGDRPGVSTRRMKTQGWWASTTAYVQFDDVRVPVGNLIGHENQGFKYIMHNFNHESFVLGAQANRFARVCLEEAVAWARQRKTFGRAHIQHQVIRHKIGEMARRIESTHAWIEQLAYQMQRGGSKEDSKMIGGQIALMKVHATKNFEFCAREASQILGGASYVREGKGRTIERLYREVRVSAIGGGSEEVLMDMAVKQAKL